MEHLRTLLTSQKLSVDNLEQKVRDFGFDPQTLTPEQAELIAKELVSSLAEDSNPSAMTKGQEKNGSKPAPKKRTNRKSRTAKPNAMQKAVNNVNGQSESDMAAFLTAIDSRSTKRAKEVASEALDIIADTPNRCLDHFVELAEEYQGDPNFFRGIGEEWADAIFGTSSADAAQQDDRNTSVA
ncbi:MAG: hypothetical protein F6K21_02695 [Symploca sp. SIO2D2]|nr:hypothetical protein [Symploca sp. SIO2D2]